MSQTIIKKGMYTTPTKVATAHTACLVVGCSTGFQQQNRPNLHPFVQHLSLQRVSPLLAAQATTPGSPTRPLFFAASTDRGKILQCFEE